MSTADNTEEKHITCADDMNNLHITSTKAEEVDVCASCGKEGSDGLKACTACKIVKYCKGFVKLRIDQSIKKHAENVPPYCMMKNYLSGLHHLRIVQSVCCLCHRLIRGLDTKRAVEMIYAAGVFMQLN